MAVAVFWIVVLGFAQQALAVPDASADASWVRPVDGPVVQPFENPDRYGPGHRGVVFSTAAGTPVRAATDGAVAFAGTVAGVRWVSIDHAGGLRTTYGHLGELRVRRGQLVVAGQVIAAVGPTATLHLGLRRGDDYLDPMPRFGAPGRARVRLVTPRASGAGEARVRAR